MSEELKHVCDCGWVLPRATKMCVTIYPEDGCTHDYRVKEVQIDCPVCCHAWVIRDLEILVVH